MSGIKKLFAKKQKVTETEPTQRYELIDSNSLTMMSQQELIKIIHRYNKESTSLNAKVEDLTLQVSTSQSQTSVLTEELNLHKEHNKILNKELYEGSVALNEYKHSLETLQEQLDNTKNQLIPCDSPCFKILPSRSHEQIEIDTSFEQQKQLKSKIKDYEIMDQKLNITIKLLETEIEKQKITIQKLKKENSQSETENSTLKDTIKNLETQLNKRNIDYENERDQKNILILHKDGVETEVRTMKEELKKKEKRAYKYAKKLKNTQEDLKAKIEEIFELQSTLKKNTSEHTNQLTEMEEKHRTDSHKRYEEYENHISKLTDRLNDLELILKTEKEHMNSESSDIIQTLTLEKNELNKLVSTQKQQIEKLQNSLASLKQKQNCAKHELLKLTQKLKEKQPTEREQFKFDPNVVSRQDVNSLTSFHTELESIYKYIMTVLSSSNSEIMIPVIEFTEFEKKMSNLLLQIHEAIELAVELRNNHLSEVVRNQSTKKRNPLKIFSCVRLGEDNDNLVKLPKKKIAGYNSGTLPSRNKREVGTVQSARSHQ